MTTRINTEAALAMLGALQQALPIIDAYRRTSGGDGDIAAMNVRAAITAATTPTMNTYTVYITRAVREFTTVTVRAVSREAAIQAGLELAPNIELSKWEGEVDDITAKAEEDTDDIATDETRSNGPHYR